MNEKIIIKLVCSGQNRSHIVSVYHRENPVSYWKNRRKFSLFSAVEPIES